MSATELLPCPFCGGEASAYPDGDMEGYVYRCWNTKRCEMSIFGHATDEEAAESWNTRSYPEGCTPTDIRVLRQANVDLAAESERNRVDAERYRLLRSSIDTICIVRDTTDDLDAKWPQLDGWVAIDTELELDSHIDAALAAKDSP